jgi:anti-sigma factor RsiW
MKHSELQMLLSSYLDGEVNDADNAKVLSHLDTCAECKQFIEHVKQMREAIRSLGEIELPYDFAARTARLVERGDEQVEEWLGVEPLARNTFFVIAVTVLVMFFLTSFNKGASPGIAEVLIDGSDGDSAATQVLLQPGDLSKNDLLYAVMTK